MKFCHVLSLPIAGQARTMRKSCSIFPDSSLLPDPHVGAEGLQSLLRPYHQTKQPPSTGRKVATGALHLLPGSDTKFPMRQWPGHSRMTRGAEKRSVCGLCWLKSLPPRSGPRRYSQFHQRKTGNGEVRAKVGFSSKYNSFYQDKCDN